MTAPQQPERAGVRRRREELEAAKRERSEYRRESEGPNVGNVETKRNVAQAEARLRRLLNALRKKE